MFIGLMWGLCIGCFEPPEEKEEAVELPTETARVLLHEVFTGSTCGPCFDADAIILDVLAANPNRYVHLAYHVGGDPYTSAESVFRRMYYLPPEESSYSIPWLQVDGIHGFHPVELNEDAGYQQSDFDEFIAEPSYVDLSVSSTVTEQTVDISVNIVPLQDNSSEDLRLMVAIVENTTFLNEGTNGLTEFHHVMKKLVPDEQGMSLSPLIRGEIVDLSFTYTFQGEYDDSTGYDNPIDHTSAHTVEEFEDLSVVVFIQDSATTQVLQAAWSGQ